MKKSKLETAETRRRIVEIAAAEFRTNGIQSTGVADVMAAAGLSHGGFYRHFGSKEHLVAEACEAAIAEIIGALDAAAGKGVGENEFRTLVDTYMSTSHRDSPARGCPLASMGSELARADESTRAAASRGFDDFVDMLANRIRHSEEETSRSKAVFALSAMIGALTISRIISDPEASASLLEDVRQHVAAI
ncbi:TetR family transcriptional regulator [Caballeronia temeraria]|uniref:TetR family transcriptional regulator n=1 Tax=Caballeronia temeraria TaxID=1777137 RepID=A0A158ATV7_9BURK|nr:TetR/AcrR family transcriptional regulator [Caballeronia temeraria]SAK61159.1 TetR family transcriptional regulator [Caballeronia temeraria]